MRTRLPFTKRRLAIELSKLKGFANPKLELEQYLTDPEVASELLWRSYMLGDIESKVVADLGAGTGILGIGALLLGAKKVYFIEVDPEAVQVLEDNLNKYNFSNYEILNVDVSEFSKKVDTVVMNPPFGVQSKLDKKFFEAAAKISDVIYLIYSNIGKAKHYLKNFEILVLCETKFKLGKLYFFHEKEREFIKAYILRARRK